MEKQWKQWQALFWGAPKSLQMVIAAMKLKDAVPWKKSYDQPRQHIKKQRRYFADKGPSSQSYGFSSSHVWMWELDHKESWVPKNWCYWTMVLEKILRVPCTARRSNQSILKETNPEYWKEWWCNWSSNALSTCGKEPTHWKRPRCWERMKAKGGEDSRGWPG